MITEDWYLRPLYYDLHFNAQCHFISTCFQWFDYVPIIATCITQSSIYFRICWSDLKLTYFVKKVFISRNENYLILYDDAWSVSS